MIRSRDNRDYETLAASVTPSSVGRSDEGRMQAVVEVLWPALREAGVSWLGFYIDQPHEPDDRRLALGPRCDKPACTPIGLHGACGQALLSRRTLIVPDVKELGEGYVACDPRDRSEIVIPVLNEQGGPLAVLDLDSFDVGSFDERDARGLRSVLAAAGLRSG
jgi:putative methionine-R-sulfoxide reductase with GAF domain